MELLPEWTAHGEGTMARAVHPFLLEREAGDRAEASRSLAGGGRAVVWVASQSVGAAAEGAGDDGRFSWAGAGALSLGMSQAQTVVALDESGEGVESLDSRPSTE
jgi:hypothetical protein